MVLGTTVLNVAERPSPLSPSHPCLGALARTVQPGSTQSSVSMSVDCGEGRRGPDTTHGSSLTPSRSLARWERARTSVRGPEISTNGSLILVHPQNVPGLTRLASTRLCPSPPFPSACLLLPPPASSCTALYTTRIRDTPIARVNTHTHTIERKRARGRVRKRVWNNLPFGF